MSHDPDHFDVAVIGGGINGAGIARDATGRGARVVLLEQGDLACGTSSASTKLIHGGLRYLEHYEFALVRESLAEREALWAMAPHIIWPMRFILPHVPGLRPRWMLRAGLFVYDHIGGRHRLPAADSVRLSRHVAGAALQPWLTHGFEYSDCWVDDARLVVLNARDAAARGASIRPRTEVIGLSRESGRWTLDTLAGGVRGRVTAGAVVNAAGPAVLRLLARADVPSPMKMRLVRGSHIVVPRLFGHQFSYFFQLPDGRIFFAIPYESDFTLIGTTDQDHDGDLNQIRASDAEIAYLCDGASQFFRKAVTPSDVVWTYSGVRPLIDDGSGRPEAATRGYRLDLSDPADGAPLLSVFGGKLTTYRHLGETAVDMLRDRVPAMRGGAWTLGATLPGGDFPVDGPAALGRKMASDYPFLTPDVIGRLVRTYGTEAWALLADARSPDMLGADLGHGLTGAEVNWLVHHEWATTAEDILWRRTKLGLRFDQRQVAALQEYLQSTSGARSDG